MKYHLFKIRKKPILLRLFPILLVFLLSAPAAALAAEPEKIPGNAPRTGDAAEAYPSDGPSITGHSAIVMDMDTGDILYSVDPHRKSEPASTTKLLTATLVADRLDMGATVTVTGDVSDNLIEDAVTVGLIPGEEMSVKNLMYALLLPSANDAANALGVAVSGNLREFAELMTTTAAGFGCTETHFANANGLPDEEHYTTVYDMALIAREAYSRPVIREIIYTQSYWIPATNMSGERELWTTDELLYDVTSLYYEYCTGGKTGYTGEAGYTMVAFGEKDGRRVVAVVFGCPTSYDRFKDAAALLDYGLKEYHVIHPLKTFDLQTDPVVSTTIQSNFYTGLDHNLPKFTMDENVRLFTRSSVYEEDIDKSVSFYSQLKEDQVGEIRLSYKGQTVSTVPIRISSEQTPKGTTGLYLSFNPYVPSAAPVETQKRSEIILEFLKTWGPGILVIIGIGAMALFTLHFLRKRREAERVKVRRYMGDGEIRDRKVSRLPEDLEDEVSPRSRKNRRNAAYSEAEPVQVRRPVQRQAKTGESRLSFLSGSGNADADRQFASTRNSDRTQAAAAQGRTSAAQGLDRLRRTESGRQTASTRNSDRSKTSAAERPTSGARNADRPQTSTTGQGRTSAVQSSDKLRRSDSDRQTSSARSTKPSRTGNQEMALTEKELLRQRRAARYQAAHGGPPPGSDKQN